VGGSRIYLNIHTIFPKKFLKSFGSLQQCPPRLT
jgi:hypothetical protein